jgi:hypothetical protein
MFLPYLVRLSPARSTNKNKKRQQRIAMFDKKQEENDE